MTRFHGKRAVVTGAGQGIGAAIVRRLASEGAYVIVADINTDNAERVVAEVVAMGGRAEAFFVDVAREDSIRLLNERVGEIDVLVANAGVQSFIPVLELSDDEWERVLRVNALGTLHTLQLGGRAVRDGGSIVAISSLQARLANTVSAHYAASKAAVTSLVRSFATELASRNIRVNAVAPGRIETPLARFANEEIGRLTRREPETVQAERSKLTPLRRAGRPDEVAAAVAFLAADEASYITGETLHVAGGDAMT
jgi:NAD(P)-dependent dehydrogenase (short-subunit alcohol dehydrogenase family)